MDDDTLEIVFMLMMLTASYFTLRKNRRRRRFAVHPKWRNRKQMGMFNNLIKSLLQNDPHSFFEYTRMTPRLFKRLLSLVENKLKKDDTKTPVPITAAQRLVITLHYLAEGSSMKELTWGYLLGHTTICNIIHNTTKVLWETLYPIVLKSPQKQDFENTANGFFKRWNMPNCLGAIDGKHVNIQAPINSGSKYFNYKKNFSIVLMASCDAYCRFTMVDVGAAGANHDSAVFKESGFGEKVINGKLDIPGSKLLPNSNRNLPHFFVGDAAFPLHKNIMRPYPGEHLEDEKRIFNYRLSRARRTIENTFGILAQRWRILRRPIIAKLENCENIVLATVVLHNFLQIAEEDIPEEERKYCPTGFLDVVDATGRVTNGSWRDAAGQLRGVRRLGANNATIMAKDNRTSLKDYFMSPEGALNWQWDAISKGSLPDSF